MNTPKLPLGENSAYPNTYAPHVLVPIAREESRKECGLGRNLPFHGTDIWNAWELTWLGQGDTPVAATAEIRVPASTPNLIESKSLKLYLNSFAMTHFIDFDNVAATIATDLSASAGDDVDVRLNAIAKFDNKEASELSGVCIDSLSAQCSNWHVDANLLQADDANIVEESLHTHLLRSLCPVTGQPDIGSLQLHYVGPKINPTSLLQYVVSFREHNDFHEACVERMFVDIKKQCGPEKLSVYARYQRRGGIDINPFRSDFEDCPGNLRLWRQ